MELAERVRLSVGNSSYRFPEKEEDPITISIGVACYPADAVEIDELQNKADLSLYEAKKLGRNRVVYLEKIPNGYVFKTDQMSAYI